MGSLNIHSFTFRKKEKIHSSNTIIFLTQGMRIYATFFFLLNVYTLCYVGFIPYNINARHHQENILKNIIIISCIKHLY